MILFGRWEAVFSSTDLTETMKHETILSENSILFKTKTDSNRMDMSGFGGRTAGMFGGRTSPETNTIYVKKENIEKAQYCFQKLYGK